MSKTKIDWADYVWNPVWGCNFNCSYCYARNNIAPRFKNVIAHREAFFKFGAAASQKKSDYRDKVWERIEMFLPVELPSAWDMKFPSGSAVFVNSMSDVSSWLDEWTEKLEYAACCWDNSYTISLISLTKNLALKDRFNSSASKDYLGYTVTNNADISRLKGYNIITNMHQFVNIEPLLEPLNQESIDYLATAPAIIIGAETGSKKAKDNLPNVYEWVWDLLQIMDYVKRPKVFIKNPIYSLLEKKHGSLPEIRELLWTTRKKVI